MNGAGVRGGALFAAGTGLACAVIGGGVALAGRIMPAGYGAPVGETLFTAVIFGPLLIVAIVAARLDGRRGVQVGRGALTGLAIGFGGMMATVGDAHLAGSLVQAPGGGGGAVMLAWGAAIVLFQAGSEEVFFRGWLQPALAARWGAWPALAGASAAFAVAHLAGGERAPLSLLNLLLGGLVFGMLAMRGGGLSPAVAAHFAWNAGEQLLFGLDPNPGVGSFGTLVDRDLVGSAIWGGSAEGLNGSVVMTAVLLAILVPLGLARKSGSTAPAAVSPPPGREPSLSGPVP